MSNVLGLLFGLPARWPSTSCTGTQEERRHVGDAAGGAGRRREGAAAAAGPCRRNERTVHVQREED